MAEWMVGMGFRSWQVPEFLSLLTSQQDYFDALPIAAVPERAGTSAAWTGSWPVIAAAPMLAANTTPSGGSTAINTTRR